MEIDGLIRCLAEMDGKPRPATAEGALDFVRTYGFLRRIHGPEPVETIVHEIRVAQSVVEFIDSKDWKSLFWWAFDNREAIRVQVKFTHFEDDDTLELFFGPKTLIDAIYLQALDDVAAGTEFEACDNPGCGKWFRVGPGSGRKRIKYGRRDETGRRKRRFCSPKCQSQFAYRLRKGEIK
jgi:hypothetical protein